MSGTALTAKQAARADQLIAELRPQGLTLEAIGERLAGEGIELQRSAISERCARLGVKPAHGRKRGWRHRVTRPLPSSAAALARFTKEDDVYSALLDLRAQDATAAQDVAIALGAGLGLFASALIEAADNDNDTKTDTDDDNEGNDR